MTVSYVPRRVVFTDDGPAVDWIPDDGQPYREPFFEQTLGRMARAARAAGRSARRTPIDALRGDADAVAPTAFVFHVSRCGSTLVCRMLATLENSVVISEAPVLDDVLRLRRDDPSLRDADRVAWFRGAVAALCRRNGVPAARAFVKLDAWHLFALPLVRRAFPDAPFVFVYRDPLEVLVSLARMPSLALVRDTIAPEELGLTPEDRNARGEGELAAAVIGAYYRAALAHRDELTPLPYEALPDGIWRVMPGPPFSDDEIASMRTAALHDAKNPTQPFVPDAGGKTAAATQTQRAACARWTDGPYAAWCAAASARPTPCGRPLSPFLSR